MTFMNLMLFIIIGVGITNLAVNASILDNPRNFVIEWASNTEGFSWVAKLISCMMCSGFWVGFFLTIHFWFSDGISFNPVYGGAIVSLFSYAFGSMMDYLDLSIAVVGSEIEEIEEAEE